MTDTNTSVQEDKKDTVTPVTTAAVSGEEKKVEAEATPAAETAVEEKKVE